MTAFSLRVIALVCMFCDHLGRIVLPDQVWLTFLGRMAFPIFAFQIADGYQHTRSKIKYALRLLLFAVLAEIPFDLMAYGAPFYWGHQNVIWTLLLGFVCICLAENLTTNLKYAAARSLIYFGLSLFFFIAGTMLYADYIGLGVLQVFIFYLCRDLRSIPIALVGTILLNYIGSGEPYLSLAGAQIPSQLLAVLSLIPIYLYNGKQGYRSKGWTWFCYAFYPAHLLVLSIFRVI